jgi:hypothetical protein
MKFGKLEPGALIMVVGDHPLVGKVCVCAVHMGLIYFPHSGTHADAWGVDFDTPQHRSYGPPGRSGAMPTQNLLPLPPYQEPENPYDVEAPEDLCSTFVR